MGRWPDVRSLEGPSSARISRERRKMAHLEGETSNALIEALTDWNQHLQQANIRLEDLRD